MVNGVGAVIVVVTLSDVPSGAERWTWYRSKWQVDVVTAWQLNVELGQRRLNVRSLQIGPCADQQLYNPINHFPGFFAHLGIYLLVFLIRT